ncbi:MAG: twin-arginine translocase TatA/TatE family subunit [Angustibacter sp.]
MFDINGGEFLILVVVALVVLGPERLPQYAQQLGRLVREARGFAVRAREQVRNEMGEEFDDVDWKALDPRQYDPRRIVREALLDGDDDPFGLNDFKQPTARMQDAPDDTSELTSSEGAASPRATTRPSTFDADAT